jgi:hypothetical protein
MRSIFFFIRCLLITKGWQHTIQEPLHSPILSAIPLHSQQLTTRALSRNEFKGLQWIAVLPRPLNLCGIDVYVSRIVDKSPARDLKPRCRVKERHGWKEQVLGDHEDKLLIAVLLTSKCAPISQLPC